MDKRRLQWHPAFFAVLQIEFEKEASYLEFYPEYNLTRKPMQIDALVIKKDLGRVIQKNIGRIFRQYNVVEYKSGKDYVNVNDFYKTVGYACTLQSNTERVQEIRPTQVTVTLAAGHYPKSLVSFLKKVYDIKIEKAYPGIYHIQGLLFPLQLLVIRELSKEDNRWLSRLRDGLQLEEDIEVLAREYKGKEKNPLYEVAMDLIMRANWEKYKEVRTMCDALKELFADELKEREMLGMIRGIEQGKEQGELAKLVAQIKRKKEKGQSVQRIAEDLMEPFEVVKEIYDLIKSYPECDMKFVHSVIAGKERGELKK